MERLIQNPKEYPLTSANAADRGLQLVRGGCLRELREKLGLTHTAMASFLYISPITYRRLEEQGEDGNPQRRVWGQTAERVSRFYTAATRQVQQMEDEGWDLSTMLPLPLAASQLGLPQEVLFHRYRAGEVDLIDLGVLGHWMLKSTLYNLEP